MKFHLYAKDLQFQIDEYILNNVGSVDRTTTLWMAHKAFIGGVLTKMGSHAKKRRTQRIDEVLSQVESTESLNKITPSHSLNLKLLALRQELRSLLLETFEKNIT